MYTRALQLDPKYASAHANLARSLLKAGKEEKALEYAAKAFDLDPKNSNNCDGLGNVLLQLHRYGEAIELFQQAAALAPENAVHQSNWGVALWRAKKNN